MKRTPLDKIERLDIFLVCQFLNASWNGLLLFIIKSITHGTNKELAQHS